MRFWSGNTVTTKIKRQKPPCARRVGHEPDCPLNGEQVVRSHLHVRLHCSLLCCGHSRNPLVESKQRCRYLPEASFDRRCLLACCSCVIAQDAERPGKQPQLNPDRLRVESHQPASDHEVCHLSGIEDQKQTPAKEQRNTVSQRWIIWEETQSREKKNTFSGDSVLALTSSLRL